MSSKLNSLKFATSLVITIILTLGFSISLQSLFAAWTAPSNNPPENNVTDLTVSGGLGVNGNTAIIGNFLASGTKMALYANTATGNVSIGTTSPSSQLHVYKNDNLNNAEIALQSGNGTTLQNKWSIYNSGLDGTGSLRFWNESITGEKNALTVLNNGNVGIGTTEPISLLHLRRDQNAGTIINIENQTSGTIGYARQLLTTTGANAWFDLYSAAYDSTGAMAPNTANLGSNGAGGLNLETYYSNMRFFTGGGAVSNERMTIDSAGNVGIGKNNPSTKLDVNGITKTTQINSATYCDASGGSCKAITDMGGGGYNSLDRYVERLSLDPSIWPSSLFCGYTMPIWSSSVGFNTVTYSNLDITCSMQFSLSAKNLMSTVGAGCSTILTNCPIGSTIDSLRSAGKTTLSP